MTPEDKKEYRVLQRKVQEAGSKLYDRGTFGRIKSKSPNLYNNRLKKIQEFCIEKGLTESRRLKVTPVE